eukprot:gnl/MRDRNA2_/MRDRNA2_405491_c0_seq1.p1 gnl/MRDRNA2_/MRDRNA2_405491_c0~~gnl/MRDRNA2_/MRDRNA2_405491_c0_seq1.p1  ORF type:complete len:141 (+),score=20.91 gnl/MRDRNA2_/MRDRNA2_405491_c0_seq1:59-424(+)
MPGVWMLYQMDQRAQVFTSIDDFKEVIASRTQAVYFTLYLAFFYIYEDWISMQTEVLQYPLNIAAALLHLIMLLDLSCFFIFKTCWTHYYQRVVGQAKHDDIGGKDDVELDQAAAGKDLCK